MENDVRLEAEELPGGFTPLWLDVPQATTHLEIVTRLSQLTEIGNKSVTVLYFSGERDGAAEQECERLNWNYRDLAGDTPLMVALKDNMLDIAKVLIQSPLVDVTITDFQGQIGGIYSVGSRCTLC